MADPFVADAVAVFGAIGVVLVLIVIGSWIRDL